MRKSVAPSSSRNFSSESESEIQEFHDEENYNVEEQDLHDEEYEKAEDEEQVKKKRKGLGLK